MIVEEANQEEPLGFRALENADRPTGNNIEKALRLVTHYAILGDRLQHEIKHREGDGGGGEGKVEGRGKGEEHKDSNLFLRF